MAKNVCIIGAGPSGLVAAKTFLHDVAPGSFNVTIFDAQQRIGGLWPAHIRDSAGLIDPLMVANQSKHTVQFSDFAWRDSDPDFPRAWQIGRYLQRYIDTYGGADLRLGHRVVKTELLDGGSWKVQTQSEKGLETSIFDYLVVATGYFGSPRWPEGIPREGDIPIIHSSHYRDVEALVSEADESSDKILVVGGQMSGVVIAGTIATDLSSLVHSPGDKPVKNAERFSVHHVAHRPVWTAPLYTCFAPDASAPPFMPLDLASCNIAQRPRPFYNTQGHITVETAREFNKRFLYSLRTDQSEFSPGAKIDGTLLDEPPYLAVSTHFYMEFVRSGQIKIHKGRLSNVEGTAATVSSDGSDETITGVAAVVMATGFDPTPSISFLPPSVLETISHSPAHPHLPVALSFHGTHHPALPTLGFVGFYRAPYWGVMEMQARFVARLFQEHMKDGNESADSSAFRAAIGNDKSIPFTLALRDNARCSQFPMGDYAFLMQEFAAALGLPISPPIESDLPFHNFSSFVDILTPARYLNPGASEAQRQQALQNLRSTHNAVVASLTGRKYIAATVFRSLLGEWHLERSIVSKLPSHPSGRFVGTAKFLLRTGTVDGRKTGFPTLHTNGDSVDGSAEIPHPGLEYLYIEDGEFTAAGTNLRFRATRRYVWRYDEINDKLSVWFARTDDPTRADYLFHDIEFLPLLRDECTAIKYTGQNRGWCARASHLCINDLYDVNYEFFFRAVNLTQWRLRYSVRGPKKDYTIDGTYRRESA